MWKKTLLFLLVVGAFSRCDFEKKETTRLRTMVDSLKTEIETNQKTAQTLQEVGTLLDSIDASRSILKTKMVEGTSFNDYTDRMRELRVYVSEVERKITSLEETVAASRNKASAYSVALQRLKQDLEIQNQELAAVQEQVNRYHNENQNLVQTVSLQKAEITDKLNQIEVKQQEVVQLENQVKELQGVSKSEEAEAYFRRARAVEETARRTRFAPRKKKETRKEALELYKMAAFYGKEEAKEKVTELESQI